MITGIPDGTPCTLVRPVHYHVPGRGHLVVPAGTVAQVVDVDRLPPWQRQAIAASAERDEKSRNVEMLLVHVLGAPRLLDWDDVEID